MSELAPAHPTINQPVDSTQEPSHEAHRASLAALTFGALGVVFGDIGTSPLYTLQECFGPRGVPADQPANVLGVLSLFFWSLVLVACLKYAVVLMQADNRGEGGVMALLGLIPESIRRPGGWRVGWVTWVVLAAAGMLFADGVITPAISLLSAVEGLKMVNPALERWVVPLAAAILLGLFALQSKGTSGLGKLFAPVMILWFVVIAGLGALQTWQNPRVLMALSPHHAVHFLLNHGLKGFTLLGSVVLCVTGAEALHADMGHFGRKPIRLGWAGLVFPALTLCYFGQGALLLQRPEAAEAPFFSLLQHPGARIALVLLATAATVIASQGLISAVFSLTHQSIRLGYFPRLMVVHTSDQQEGQIYVPGLNWVLGLSCLTLVLVFQQSSRLAAGFGLAVSATMLLTSIVLVPVVRHAWGWSWTKSLALLALFLSFDVPFFLASCLKIPQGGYLPLLLCAAFFGVTAVWTRGRTLLEEHYKGQQVGLEQLLTRLAADPPTRTPTLGVYLTSNPEVAPPVLLLQLQHLAGVPEDVVFVMVLSDSAPTVAAAESLEVSELQPGYYRVVARCGYLETPHLPDLLARAREQLKLQHPLEEASYFVGRESFAATDAGRLRAWEESCFAFMARNASDIARYFALPTDRVVEMGVRIDL